VVDRQWQGRAGSGIGARVRWGRVAFDVRGNLWIGQDQVLKIRSSKRETMPRVMLATWWSVAMTGRPSTTSRSRNATSTLVVPPRKLRPLRVVCSRSLGRAWGTGSVDGRRRHQRFAAESGEIMKLRAPLPIGLMLLVAACVDPPTPDYRAPNPVYHSPPTPTFSANAASLLLKPGMTEAAVASTVGAQPVSADLSTCGSRTPAPWQCKKLHYRDSPYGAGGKDLLIYFQEVKGVWLVNSWSVL
jgi:hypothetical protein